MAVRSSSAQHGRLPPTAPGACAPGADAARTAWQPLQFGEAPRIGILGDSGAGKSTAERALIEHYAELSPGLIVIVDDKGPVQRFAGQPRRDVADLCARPLDPAPPPPTPARRVVFRGEAFEGYKVNRDEVAAYCYRVVGRRYPCLQVYDELKEAAAYGSWKQGHVWLPRSLGQGREVGLSTLWGTQDTQEVPPEAFNQSSCIFCFRIAGNGLRLLGQRGYLEGGVEETILALPCDDVPPAERGAFVLLRRGRPWDGIVYRFDVRRREPTHERIDPHQHTGRS